RFRHVGAEEIAAGKIRPDQARFLEIGLHEIATRHIDEIELRAHKDRLRRRHFVKPAVDETGLRKVTLLKSARFEENVLELVEAEHRLVKLSAIEPATGKRHVVGKNAFAQDGSGEPQILNTRLRSRA